MAIEMQSVINGFLEGSIRTAGREPVINELIVSENGTYTAPSDIDGYSPVIVNVPKTPLNKLTVTDNGTYTAPTGTGYDEVNVNVPLPSNAYLLKEIEDVDIASFSDGSNLPMPKLQVGIEPQQDLHGYDNPWAGGAGKNKSEKKITEFSYAPNANGSASVSGDILTVTTTSSNNSGVYSILDFVKSFTGKCSYSVDVKANTNGDVLIGMTNAGRKNVSLTTNWQRVKFEDVTFDGNSKPFVIYSQGTANTIQLKDFMFETGSTAHDYEPYSNICPISGWTDCEVTVADDLENPTTSNVYTIDLNGTRYGGKLDVVSGVLTVTDDYIASYNGETLPATWISDRDVYTEGTTPTAGAEVVYELATPIEVQLTPTQVKSLLGSNNVWADTGSVNNIEYFAK